MKITDLVKMDSLSEENHVYGIEVNEYIVDLPYHLDEIGLIAKKDESGTLCYDVLDTALAFINNNVEVIIEVPFGFDIPEKSVLQVALSAGISLSILPPVDGSDSDYEKYAETLSVYTELWLAQSNATKMVYPSSGYFQYMINEVFDYKTPEISTSEYIINNFVKNIDIETMDKIKDKLRIRIHGALGGKDEFEKFAHSLATGVLGQIKEQSPF